MFMACIFSETGFEMFLKEHNVKMCIIRRVIWTTVLEMFNFPISVSMDLVLMA